ncbi:MAG: hypothetical protein AB7D43_12070 [Sulfurimonadaceae bacterium]|jgi:hypothetical protein
MEEFKLKMILAMVGGIFFSFIIILLAFILPLDKPETIIIKPKGVLERVSHSVKK